MGCSMSISIEGVKFDICCAARALYRAGLSAGIAGHLSVAIGENKMLMNRFGPSFGTLRPADICTTVYHLMGIDPDMAVYDKANRPVPINYGGQPIHEILS